MDNISNPKTLLIRAEWIEEDAIWLATSPDLPGLVTEAQDFEALRRRLSEIIPDFIKARQELEPSLPDAVICDFEIRQSATLH